MDDQREREADSGLETFMSIPSPMCSGEPGWMLREQRNSPKAAMNPELGGVLIVGQIRWAQRIPREELP